ncbi:hypothetical protein yc1106_04742 [Curvularia clavata]|uniref:Saccharopine dehydrogenase NADP binding domain-containing protein n=1 Tax=Curvularia clavata TaxID=95742 RepID=A0A9Q9DRG7_CURCL|nr:hypothetical protein yc1106_04742 [Curvularia clavata]
MAQESRKYELVLLGATGYTGKLVAEWITTHLPDDLRWAVAGRNEKKLQDVVAELSKLRPDRKEPAIETCAHEPSSLDALAKSTTLLITTVGPFMYYGEPVLAACVENGTHYLDSTGEVPWIYDMISKYDALARKNKTIIIPECGLDSVPADIMAYVLARQVRKRYNAACERAVMTLYAFKSGISGGTSLTMLELFKKYSLSHLAKSMHPYSLSPVAADGVAGPPPSASLATSLVGLKTIPELGGIQTTGLMAAVDECIAHRSWGLYQTSPDEKQQYGPRFRFNEYARAPSFFVGLAQKVVLGSIAALLAIPVTRWIMEPIFRRVAPSPGQGPSRESMKKDFMHYRGVGYTQDGKKVLADLEVAHGGYVATAITLSAAAKVMLRGRLGETEAGRLGGGILTPATLGDEYVNTLDEFGMKIRVQE